MAGNIQQLSITKLNEKSHEYGTAATSLYESVKSIVESIKGLENYWTGRRMNSIVEKYNSISEALNNDLVFFGSTVSGVLQEILEQYTKMENSGIALNATVNCSIAVDIPRKLPLTTTATVKFEKQRVTNMVSTINGHFASLDTNLAKMINVLDDVAPYSDSLKKLVTNYKAAADSIKSNTTGLKTQLKEQIDKAVSVVNTTEGYNEGDASRIKSGNK